MKQALRLDFRGYNPAHFAPRNKLSPEHPQEAKIASYLYRFNKTEPMSAPTDHENELFNLALRFIQETPCHVFLTGKAGTGKTTFLKQLRAQSKKSMIVIAPTGIAAINAGGVTMHSFFQLPFKPYIHQSTHHTPGYQHTCDRHELLSKLKFRKEKQQLIREVELIVIDEVSMMRADHLEAIHQVLKFVRKRQEPFGGVQMLFIGDLNQLPPVVVEEERRIIEEQYASPYFFDAPIMKEASCYYIELKKIYRQNEAHFIHILNRIRNNDMMPKDFQELNKRYDPDFHSNDQKYITLTSHNYKADEINRIEMDRLQDTAFSYHGKIEGDFNVKQLPAEMIITLKVGAQVMFIKNDSSEEKNFYNGKLASVTNLTETEIVVYFSEQEEHFTLTKEEWKNITYELNEESGRIEEKVIGRFIQYPIRAAWAITIHKSQGLTFERAIVDAGSSFAPGQVYVALSRCTHMEGLVLRSKITPSSIHSDTRIHEFARKEISLNELHQHFQAHRQDYEHQRILELFRLDSFLNDVQEIYNQSFRSKFSLPPLVSDGFTKMRNAMEDIEKVGYKFIPVLRQLLQQAEQAEGRTALFQRCAQAIPWFSEQLYESQIRVLPGIYDSLKPLKSSKPITTKLNDYEERIWKRIEKIQAAEFRGEALSPSKENKPVMEPRQAPPLKHKTSTIDLTLHEFRQGKSLEEIAALRHITVGTVEKHIQELIGRGDITIHVFVRPEELDEIYEVLSKEEEFRLRPVYDFFEGRFTYNQLRAALSYFIREGRLTIKPNVLTYK